MLEELIPLIPQFLWATNFVVSKVIVSRGLHALVLTAIRWSLAGALLYIYTKITGDKIRIGKELVIPAITGITGFSALIYAGLMVSKASIVGLTMALIPIFTAILARSYLKERLSLLLNVSIVLGFIGEILLTLGGLRGLTWLGAILGALAALDWAIYTVTSKKVMKDMGPMNLLTSAAIMAQPLNWILAIPFISIKPLLDPIVDLGIIYVSLVPGFLAYFLWLYSVKLVGASKAGVYINALPLLTLILAYFTLEERLGLLESVGALLILMALALVTYESLKERH